MNAPRAALIIESSGWYRRMALQADRPCLIGRGSDCQVSLPDLAVSRRHCEVRFDEDTGWVVEDLGSAVGTSVDDRRIQAPTPLKNQAEIDIGHSRMTFKVALAENIDPMDAGQLLTPQLIGSLIELAATDNLKRTLELVLGASIQAVDGQRGGLFLAADDELELAVVRGHFDDGEHQFARSLPREALRSAQAMVLDRSTRSKLDTDLVNSVFRKSLGSVVCIPLMTGNKAVGVLYVDTVKEASRYSADQLATLEEYAAYCAAILNSRQQRDARLQSLITERGRLSEENQALRSGIRSIQPLGDSDPMQSLFDQIRRIGPSDETITLTGPTGTGKEVLARYIHQMSPRGEGPFVVVDCGALPGELIEAELFGHEKGAYTGADVRRLGRFREADGGTVFLDEIGELPAALQPKLLRVLQNKTVQPVGGRSTVDIDVRIICATNRNLEQMVDAGDFRTDLYYRISVVELKIAPLKARGDDVLLLARHFIKLFDIEERISDMTHSAREALRQHDWPGNVRELENRVRRAVLMCDGPMIRRQDFGFADEPSGEAGGDIEPLKQARECAKSAFERTYLEALLKQTSGRINEACEIAGVSRALLHRLMQRHGLKRADYVG